MNLININKKLYNTDTPSWVRFMLFVFVGIKRVIWDGLVYGLGLFIVIPLFAFHPWLIDSSLTSILTDFWKAHTVDLLLWLPVPIIIKNLLCFLRGLGR